MTYTTTHCHKHHAITLDGGWWTDPQPGHCLCWLQVWTFACATLPYPHFGSSLDWKEGWRKEGDTPYFPLPTFLLAFPTHTLPATCLHCLPRLGLICGLHCRLGLPYLLPYPSILSLPHFLVFVWQRELPVSYYYKTLPHLQGSPPHGWWMDNFLPHLLCFLPMPVCSSQDFREQHSAPVLPIHTHAYLLPCLPSSPSPAPLLLP